MRVSAEYRRHALLAAADAPSRARARFSSAIEASARFVPRRRCRTARGFERKGDYAPRRGRPGRGNRLRDPTAVEVEQRRTERRRDPCDPDPPRPDPGKRRRTQAAASCCSRVGSRPSTFRLGVAGCRSVRPFAGRSVPETFAAADSCRWLSRLSPRQTRGGFVPVLTGWNPRGGTSSVRFMPACVRGQICAAVRGQIRAAVRAPTDSCRWMCADRLCDRACATVRVRPVRVRPVRVRPVRVRPVRVRPDWCRRDRPSDSCHRTRGDSPRPSSRPRRGAGCRGGRAVSRFPRPRR
jgi:hypothetical protein